MEKLLIISGRMPRSNAAGIHASPQRSRVVRGGAEEITPTSARFQGGIPPGIPRSTAARSVIFLKKIIPRRIFSALQPWYHFALAFMAAVWYRFPSRSIVVIGVTGTKGKTTVVELIHEILASSGAQVASLSSLRFRIKEQSESNESKMTVPGRFFVQSFLRRALNAKCKYVVLEVTSEAIKQFRHRFVKFHTAALTQIAPEHIESHGSFERYLRAKLDLFWRVPKEGLVIINEDSEHAPRFSAASAAHKMWYGRTGIRTASRIYPVKNVRVGMDGMRFELAEQEFFSPLRGEFNFYNVLAAVAVGISEHITMVKIADALERVAIVPGRMEIIQEKPYTVVVDYAHTPDSLRKVYETLRRENSKFKTQNSKLICVLGAAGGGRDKWKRPEFGKIAAEHCSSVILTNEDPYDENPEAILNEIESGLSQIRNSKFSPPQIFKKNLGGQEIPTSRKILDRREAIREALREARPGDIVIFTGKGSEPWIMGPDHTKVWWNEKEVVMEELNRLPLKKAMKKT